MSPADVLDAARESRRLRTAVIVAALLALAAFANTLANRPVYDDAVLTQNPALSSPWNLRAIFLGTWWGEAKPDSALWRPLAAWTLAWNGWWNERAGLGFLSVTGFHVFNALVHAACAALAVLLASAVGLRALAAGVVGALFAVLAIHVEAVAPISGRAETLAALFGFAGLVVHARAIPGPRSAIASASCFAAAMLCKESGVAFVPLALVFDLCVRRRRARASWIAWGIALGAFLLVRQSVVGGIRGAVYFVDNPLVDSGVVTRVATALAVQLDYLRLCAAPVGFSSDASYAQLELATSFGDSRTLGALAVVAGAAVVAWRANSRRHELLFAFAAWIVLFAVTSNLLVVIGTARAERLAYAPSLGLCLLAGIGIEALAKRARTIAIAALSVLGAWNLAACWSRNAVWRDGATLFRAQVEEAPRSAKAHFNLGTQLAEERDDRGAIAQYEEALRIHARYHEAWHNLGGALRRVGERERALEAYSRAIESMNAFVPPKFGIVQTLHELGRDEEARAALARIERESPGHPWIAPTRRLVGLPPR